MWRNHICGLIMLDLLDAGRARQLADLTGLIAAQNRAQALEAARKAEAEGMTSEGNLSEDIVQPLRARHRDRHKHIEDRSDGNGGHGTIAERHDEIELLLIAIEREHINELFRSGMLKDKARRRIERDLDLREAGVANQWTEQ
jgi:monovalent cation/hydrogen antiporter